MSEPRQHQYTLRVYYEDTDAGGVVYHAQYLAFAERARTEAMRDLGIPHAVMDAEFGRIFMVRRVNLEYCRPARLDDSLFIVTTAMGFGAATARLRQEFKCKGVTLAVLEVLLVCVDRRSLRPARIPARFRGVMEERPRPDADAPATAPYDASPAETGLISARAQQEVGFGSGS